MLPHNSRRHGFPQCKNNQHTSTTLIQAQPSCVAELVLGLKARIHCVSILHKGIESKYLLMKWIMPTLSETLETAVAAGLPPMGRNVWRRESLSILPNANARIRPQFRIVQGAAHAEEQSLLPICDDVVCATKWNWQARKLTVEL